MCSSPAARCSCIGTTTSPCSTPRSTRSGRSKRAPRPHSAAAPRCAGYPGRGPPRRWPAPIRATDHWRRRACAPGVAPKCWAARTSPSSRPKKWRWRTGRSIGSNGIRGRAGPGDGFRAAGRRVDLRRAVARSLRTGGDVLDLPHRTRRLRPRPVVLLCDVSGSMERYSRMLLHFAHALTRRHRRVEAFLFSTQLTRVTRQLRAAPDRSGGGRRVEGGARLVGGHANRRCASARFHQQWSRRALRGGPVVLLISDGWDRGDPLRCCAIKSPGFSAAATGWSGSIRLIGTDWVRAADARPAGRAAVRGRLSPGADADESRRPGITLGHAVGAPL